MLYDFNKLLPNKTSNKALGLIILLIVLVGIIMLLCINDYY